MSESRHRREPGTLPGPLAMFAALILTGGTAAAIWWLPAQAAPEQHPSRQASRAPAAAALASPTQSASPEGPAGFVAFVDTAREPGFNLPADARRTGIRWYALGHLIAGGDGCQPSWTGKLAPGSNPVANRIGRLRAEGADAGPIFGGPGGRELAASCVRPGGLAAAYRRVTGSFDASYLEFEIRDSSDTATVLRRARAIHSLQQERPLRVTFTLPLQSTGLSARDADMLRLTRQEGATVATVNLLAAIEPQSAPAGRMRRVSTAVGAAQQQIVQAMGLTDAESWHRVALTSVLAGPAGLSELDARKLTSYSARHELAWLSLRGAAPSPAVSRILWRTRS